MKAVAYMKPGLALVDIPEPTPHCEDYVKLKMAYGGFVVAIFTLYTEHLTHLFQPVLFLLGMNQQVL